MTPVDQTDTVDQQFIEFIIKALVSNPDEVKIARRIDERGVLLELSVDPEDLGRVIGKHGGTAQSIRTLLRALGTKNDARYNLKIIENDREDGGHRESSRNFGQSYDESYSPDDEARLDAAIESAALSSTRKELASIDDLDI